MVLDCGWRRRRLTNNISIRRTVKELKIFTETDGYLSIAFLSGSGTFFDDLLASGLLACGLLDPGVGCSLRDFLTPCIKAIRNKKPGHIAVRAEELR